ncbi:MAG TPA: UDP-galactopyranose mutase [Nitrospirae bacterium]|nr:UDP-galactopyranose mutase [Nitrospirota bacterium]
MYLIAGSGLAGSVLAERIASVLKKEVLVVERRDHIGGNVYDYKDSEGIFIHKYGPHAFHTNDESVWAYLSRFTEWYPYFHRVRAIVDGIEIPLPFNLNALYMVFPPGLASRLETKLVDTFGYNVKIPILKLKEFGDKDLQFLSGYIYEKVFLGYTLKQWGLTPENLYPSVTARVPVYISRDDRYFQDRYQGIPENGYTSLIERMLDNPLIRVELNTDFRDVKDSVKFEKLIYTGCIDEFFDFRFGELSYRSLDFSLKSYDTEFFQPVAQVNYPENHDYTRITEYKHFLDTRSERTTVAYEYPQAYERGGNDPYYPIPNDENSALYAKYSEEARKLHNVVFIGRLAEYKYYNMDQIVARALRTFEELR